MTRDWIARLASLSLLLAFFPACSSDDSAGAGDTGSGAGSASSNASGTASTASGGDCGAEQWTCSPWQTSGGDEATRVCTDSANAGTTNCKPVETATLPALDLNYYKCNVEPIVDHKCSQLGCHGTEEGRAYRIYARGRLRLAGGSLSEPQYCQGQATSADLCSGSASCGCRAQHTPEEWQRNYDSARSFALDANLQPIAAGQEDTSELIAQPIVGGKAHAGIHLFRDGDSDHTTLRDWLSGKTLASCDPTPN